MVTGRSTGCNGVGRGAVLIEEGHEEDPGMRTQATIFMQNP